MDFEHLDANETQITGTGAEFLRLHHGLSDLQEKAEDSEAIGAHPHMHWRPPSDYLDDVRDKLPAEEELENREEDTFAGRFEAHELETLCGGLQVARNYLRRLGRASGNAEYVSKAAVYDVQREELLPAIRAPGAY